jgi:hypothetical protein
MIAIMLVMMRGIIIMMRLLLVYGYGRVQWFTYFLRKWMVLIHPGNVFLIFLLQKENLVIN